MIERVTTCAEHQCISVTPTLRRRRRWRLIGLEQGARDRQLQLLCLKVCDESRVSSSAGCLGVGMLHTGYPGMDTGGVDIDG